jgi:hypothetical protein
MRLKGDHAAEPRLTGELQAADTHAHFKKMRIGPLLE